METTMTRTTTLMVAAAAFASLAMAATVPANAAQLPARPAGIEQSHSQVQTVDYRNYCGRWRAECRERWGFTWRFRRCVAARGCY
jgi:Spy/CpxP family protein refolding chaperone